MIGSLLAGTVYWACTVLVLYFSRLRRGHGCRSRRRLTSWCVCSRSRRCGSPASLATLACFASLNIYIPASPARSGHRRSTGLRAARPPLRPANPAQRAQCGAGLLRHQHPVHLPARYQPGRADRSRCQRHFYYDLSAVYARRAAGCWQGRYRVLAAIGSLLCLPLLAMVGWKSSGCWWCWRRCGCAYPGAGR